MTCPNNMRLKPDHCPKCGQPTLRALDHHRLALEKHFHPHPVDKPAAIAAYTLGHQIATTTGTPGIDHKIAASWRPGDTTPAFLNTYLTPGRDYYIAHAHPQPNLPYKTPPPEHETEYDLFNQPPDDTPPY